MDRNVPSINPHTTVEFRDLRWAVVASRYRSLRQAADALNIRQSTLSRRLRLLEEQLDTVLFERTNGGTRPTREGQEFLKEAKQIIDHIEKISAQLKTYSRSEKGRLTIGVHASISVGNLRSTLIEYRRRFPGIEMYLVDGTSDHLISSLLCSAIDIAFIAAGNVWWGDKSLPVWSERLVVAIPDDHPLCARDYILWGDLVDQTLLLSQRGPGPELQRLVTNRISSAASCRVMCHDVSLDRLLTLVRDGWGILVVLEGATGAAYSGIVFRELREGGSPICLTFAAYWQKTNANPTLKPFLTLLRERHPDLAGGSVSA